MSVSFAESVPPVVERRGYRVVHVENPEGGWTPFFVAHGIRTKNISPRCCDEDGFVRFCVPEDPLADQSLFVPLDGSILGEMWKLYPRCLVLTSSRIERFLSGLLAREIVFRNVTEEGALFRIFTDASMAIASRASSVTSGAGGPFLPAALPESTLPVFVDEQHFRFAYDQSNKFYCVSMPGVPLRVLATDGRENSLVLGLTTPFRGIFGSSMLVGGIIVNEIRSVYSLSEEEYIRQDQFEECISEILGRRILLAKLFNWFEINQVLLVVHMKLVAKVPSLRTIISSDLLEIQLNGDIAERFSDCPVYPKFADSPVEPESAGSLARHKLPPLQVKSACAPKKKTESTLDDAE
ncbi:MAG: hypothetical protein LBH53_02370 [Puniceicoccales bacterium]|jgi:hypothetical protein|nr:hypothetical protein [Puniceicoccales bacterium]